MVNRNDECGPCHDYANVWVPPGGQNRTRAPAARVVAAHAYSSVGAAWDKRFPSKVGRSTAQPGTLCFDPQEPVAAFTEIRKWRWGIVSAHGFDKGLQASYDQWLERVPPAAISNASPKPRRRANAIRNRQLLPAATASGGPVMANTTMAAIPVAD